MNIRYLSVRYLSATYNICVNCWSWRWSTRSQRYEYEYGNSHHHGSCDTVRITVRWVRYLYGSDVRDARRTVAAVQELYVQYSLVPNYRYSIDILLFCRLHLQMRGRNNKLFYMISIKAVLNRDAVPIWTVHAPTGQSIPMLHEYSTRTVPVLDI